MPVPVADGDPGAKEISKQLKSLAQQMDNVKRGGNKMPRNLGTIGQHLATVVDTLRAGNSGDSVTPDQYTAMADAFQAIADELRPPG